MDKTFYNVHSVRLISTEIPNTSLTIKNTLNKNIDTTIFNLSKNNNKISWINESNYVDEINKIAITDNVVYNTLNMQNSDNENCINNFPNELQQNIANNLRDKINTNPNKLLSYNIITDAQYANSYYYSPSIFFNPSAKWTLPNSYHFIGETLVKHVKELIENIDLLHNIPSEIENNELFELYHSGINIIQKNYGWMYSYYQKYIDQKK